VLCVSGNGAHFVETSRGVDLKIILLFPSLIVSISSHHSYRVLGVHPMEVQIRTWDMHQVAEYGVAAHWRYKEGKTGESDDKFDERMSWLRQY